MHPHQAWDLAALNRYIGTTETLTVEFKRCDALRPAPKKSITDRILEAARDVAGMANEQGGILIYGIQESSGIGFRSATAIDAGFEPADGVNREWFIQVMRDHISPPLTDLDVAHVEVSPGRIALAVLVPQARGVARQTTDRWFPRRDAQGLRNMTVQEIEDVRGRTERPVLSLHLAQAQTQLTDNQRELTANLWFR